MNTDDACDQMAELLDAAVQDYNDLRDKIREAIAWCDARRNAPDVTTLGMVQEKMRAILE